MLNPYEADQLLQITPLTEGDYNSWALWKVIAFPEAVNASDRVRFTYNEKDVLTMTYISAVGAWYKLWSVNIQTAILVYQSPAAVHFENDPIDRDSAGNRDRSLGLGVSGMYIGSGSMYGKYLVLADFNRLSFQIIKDGRLIQNYVLVPALVCGAVLMSRTGRYVFFNNDVNNLRILIGS